MDEHHADSHHHDAGDGLEWEDLMPDLNARTDATNMIWKLVDNATGAENTAIDWTFDVGDRVKIRLINTMDSDHPMHHPFHVHGAGRFLVLKPTANQPTTSCGRTRASSSGQVRPRHPARADRAWPVDGPLPHRRAQPRRNDVQLPGRIDLSRREQACRADLPIPASLPASSIAGRVEANRPRLRAQRKWRVRHCGLRSLWLRTDQASQAQYRRPGCRI